MHTEMSNTKPVLAFLCRRLELQLQKLSQSNDRIMQRDKAIFARVIDAQTKHDTPRANVFANELTEVRKILRKIVTSKINLEEARTRLLNLGGDYPLDALALTVGLIQSAQKELVSVYPEAENELGEISSALGGLTLGLCFASPAAAPNFTEVAKTLDTRLEENLAAADYRIKECCPAVPS